MDDSRYVLRHFVCALSIDEAISASDARPIKQRVNGYDAFRASLQPELGEFGEFFGFAQSSVDGDSASGQAILMQRPGRTEIRRTLKRQPVADIPLRSEEHTSELQSLMRISYAVFCLKKKKRHNKNTQKK